MTAEIKAQVSNKSQAETIIFAHLSLVLDPRQFMNSLILWKDCHTNPKNRGRGRGRSTYNRNFDRGYG